MTTRKYVEVNVDQVVVHEVRTAEDIDDANVPPSWIPAQDTGSLLGYTRQPDGTFVPPPAVAPPVDVAAKLADLQGQIDDIKTEMPVKTASVEAR